MIESPGPETRREEPSAVEPPAVEPEQHAAEQIFARVAADVAPRTPRATYRLQLHEEFTFEDARQLLDYLDALGISDLYLSPPFQACPHSQHGYDVVDHTRLNAELGDREGFDRLTDSLAARGMGLLLDVVPNHMGIGGAGNPWWADVLENGPSSIHAGWFDIDWHPLKPELENKVLLPVLGDHYGRVLERGELQLRYERGAFFLAYWDWLWPINPRTWDMILEPVIPGLVDILGEEHEAVLELQSILTGLSHLPMRSETRRARVTERHREKEMLKKRLSALLAENPMIATAVERTLSELNGRPGEPSSFERLHLLLEEQAYRLSYYRVAGEEINYRRFFDINELAAVRMENPSVFAATHALLFELLGEGRVTGLRVDHPDGLWDPGAYLLDLQKGYFLERARREYLRSRGGAAGAVPDRAEAERWARIRSLVARRFLEVARGEGPLTDRVARPLYLVVEKILSRGERLPDDWPCHGTVGYEFGALVSALFVEHDNEKALSAIYARATGLEPNFAALVYQKKKLVLQSSLSSELAVLAHALNRLSERNRYWRDFTLGTLTHALTEIIAWFPAYRTYVNERESVRPRDRQIIERTIRMARRRSPTTDPSVYSFLESVLALELPPDAPPGMLAEARELVMRFQQLTSPVMAKGLEDTAFYVYHRLTSLNEVGGEPERFGVSPAAFHQANLERLRAAGGGLLASSTHDTKRSEDVRARISVLSEVPEAWERTVGALYALTAGERIDVEGELAPDANEQYLFFQTVLGTMPWPPPEGQALQEYTERIVAYMLKALHEAKVNSSWINPNAEYDAAVERFVRAVLREGGPLGERVRPLLQLVSYHGMWSALSQQLLKLTAPGVPDLYQGSELWELRLVDPDNRRPVDYRRRRAALDEVRRRRGEGIAFARELVERADDGRIKLFVTQAALALRRVLPTLFAQGAYRPLSASGARERHVIAFARSLPEAEVVVMVPRFTLELAGGERRPPMGEVWGDTAVALPAGRRYQDVFTSEVCEPDRPAVDGDESAAGEGRLLLATALNHFPVALLRRV